MKKYKMLKSLLVLLITSSLFFSCKNNNDPESFGVYIFNSIKSQSTSGLVDYYEDKKFCEKLLNNLDLSKEDKVKAFNELSEIDKYVNGINEDIVKYINSKKSISTNYWTEAEYDNCTYEWKLDDDIYFCTIKINYKYHDDTECITVICISNEMKDLHISEIFFK